MQLEPERTSQNNYSTRTTPRMTAMSGPKTNDKKGVKNCWIANRTLTITNAIRSLVRNISCTNEANDVHWTAGLMLSCTPSATPVPHGDQLESLRVKQVLTLRAKTSNGPHQLQVTERIAVFRCNEAVAKCFLLNN